MSAHTPGPWAANGFGHVWGDNRKVAEVDGIVQAAIYPRRSREQVAADLALIASAPDLLAAAKTAEGYLSGDMVTRMQAMRALSQAIALAEGRTS